MDNVCVGASFIAGIILCQLPEFPYNDITALGLVAFTVVFFLYKYNGQMQEMIKKCDLIMQRQEIDNNNHNEDLRQLAEGLKELSVALSNLIAKMAEMERNRDE